VHDQPLERLYGGVHAGSADVRGSVHHTVTLSYDYKSHPAIPNPPLVPIPGVITYVSAAQGNS
jgi:hypothetical protein